MTRTWLSSLGLMVAGRCRLIGCESGRRHKDEDISHGLRRPDHAARLGAPSSSCRAVGRSVLRLARP
jgi:hypothetical protein